jgi:hypothetical protein
MSDNAFEMPILGVTPKSSLLIQKITGLNPPPRTLFIGDYAQDGGLYQGRRVGNRNVVLTINLNPNPALGETVSGLRSMLYKAFIDPQIEGDFLKLLLTDDTEAKRYLVGYCETFETEIFDADTMCQISMICPDPYIRDDVDTVLTHPTGWVQVPFTYQGTAETGFEARIYLTAVTSQLTLYINGRVMQFVNPTTYNINDIVIVNTVRGQRSASWTKAADMAATTPSEWNPPTGYGFGDLVFYGPGVWRCITDEIGGGTDGSMAPGNDNDFWEYVSVSMASHLLPSSDWLELHSQDNTMRVYENGDWDGIVAAIRRLKYTSAYWGV